MSVHKKVLAVMADCAGIAKTGRNEAQHYDYVEAQQVIAQVQAAMVKHGLVCYPQVSAHQMASRNLGKNQVPGWSAKVETSLRFVDPDSDTEAIAGPFPGEAWDSGDKATAKALTMAFKYGLTETFQIPAGIDAESDEGTDEAAGNEKPDVPKQYRGGKVTLETTVPFGKHKGDTWAQVFKNAPDYPQWLVENYGNLDASTRAFLEAEIDRRAGEGPNYDDGPPPPSDEDIPF